MSPEESSEKISNGITTHLTITMKNNSVIHGEVGDYDVGKITSLLEKAKDGFVVLTSKDGSEMGIRASEISHFKCVYENKLAVMAQLGTNP